MSTPLHLVADPHEASWLKLHHLILALSRLVSPPWQLGPLADWRITTVVMDEEDDMDHWPLILNLPLHDGDRRQARWHTSVTFGTLWSVRQELPSSWRQRLDQIKQ